MMKTPDNGVLTLLDVAGSCVVDIFYNHMYDRAIAMHEKTARGLTECYRQVLAGYINESTGPRFYNTLLNSLHHYVRMSTIYQDITYSDAVGLYASLFIPNMYVASLTSDQKLNILSMVLGNTIRAFREEVVQNHIACIIDDHTDPVNVEVMQDAILRIMLAQREMTYDQFIHSQKKSPKSKQVRSQQPQQRPATAPPSPAKHTQDALNKITVAFKKAIEERALLKKSNSELHEKNVQLVGKFEELRQMFLEQLTSQKELTKLVADLKAQLQNEKAKNVKLENAPKTTTKPDESPDRSGSSDDEDTADLFRVQYIESYDENRV